MTHHPELLERLKQGNAAYLSDDAPRGDISPAIRRETSAHGQHPFAVVLACSDSRVIPEAVFSVGIGELFVVRAAGNVAGDMELGSIEYAAGHLGCRLILVLGHTGCGAVGAAMEGGAEHFIKCLTDEIRDAIGDEPDYDEACRRNVRRGVQAIREKLAGTEAIQSDTDIIGALYHISDGHVEWL